MNSESGYESLRYLLRQPTRSKPPAEESRYCADDCDRFLSPGRQRFVLMVDGERVGALLVEQSEPYSGEVTGIYVRRARRRCGHGSRLLHLARQVIPNLTVSDDRSAAGRALFAANGY